MRKHPKAPSIQIARIAYSQNPELWRTLDACRSAVRYYRGSMGKKSRGRHQPDLKAAYVPTNGIPPLPKPKTHFNRWQSIRFAGPFTALVLSDIHIPYHDAAALEAALSHGEAKGCDFILLNGDTFDCFSVSRWEKDPRKRDFKGEIEAGRELLQHLRARFRAARIVFKWGNHEERWTHYLQQKAPELLGLDDFKLEHIMGFEALGIESISEMRPIQLGKLHVIHGHEYRFAISNPVNPARGFFLRAQVSCLGGHLHQSSQHSQTRMDTHVVSCWSTGCLCDLHPDYSPINQWNHGAAVVKVEKSGAFHVENFRVIDGRVY
jgi:predicted phosphodiesterase